MPTIYTQRLDPLGSPFWSTVFAALPVLVLFYFLVPRRWLAPKAGLMGAATAIVVAVLIYRMPLGMAISSFGLGVAFGMLPVGWTIFSAMLLYNVTVETGYFAIIRRSIQGLSADARIQAILIGFSFGALLEGAAGGGTPVAICGAIMMGLGFPPFLAAVMCLIANTSPVAYGGLGTPILVLGNVTGLSPTKLSTMAAHQLPFISFIIPLWMTKCMCSWRQTLEVWPALGVSGVSFAGFQYFFATAHDHIGVTLWPMTDIGAGIFSLIVTAIFLRFWQPKKEWRFDKPAIGDKDLIETVIDPVHPHSAEAAALLQKGAPTSRETEPLTAGNISLAWTPFVIMSICLMLTGFVRQWESAVPQVEGPGPVEVFPGFATNYQIAVPGLHQRVYRDREVIELKPGEEQKTEPALFNFPWLTAPGSAVFIAAILSIIMFRMNFAEIGRVFNRTFVQMKIPIPTIACMLGLSYVTRYSGLDATVGYALAQTGILYPFFAALLGWIGVFLTGTDAGSNALFGSLQKITATTIYHAHPSAFSGLDVTQAQVLVSTANSTGGVMGKMIDAQSICVATAATNQLGKEADIFKAVFWHSAVLATIVGVMTLLQAYFPPFTSMVPPTEVATAISAAP